ERAAAIRPRLLHDRLPRALRDQAYELELAAARAHVECLRADRSSRAEDHEPLALGYLRRVHRAGERSSHASWTREQAPDRGEPGKPAPPGLPPPVQPVHSRCPRRLPRALRTAVVERAVQQLEDGLSPFLGD